MQSHDPCPDTERLQALCAGTLPAVEQDELIAHLDTCDRCRAYLDEQATHGLQPAEMGGAPAALEYQHESAMRWALASLQAPVETAFRATDEATLPPPGQPADGPPEAKRQPAPAEATDPGEGRPPDPTTGTESGPRQRLIFVLSPESRM